MDGVKDEFLSEEDLDLANLTDAELDAYWDLWLHQAQASNDLDAHLYSHGVFIEEPRIEPFPPRPAERRVLDFLLAGSGAALEALREQMSGVRVQRRSLTTAGFYLDLEPAAADRALAGRLSFEIADVTAEIRGLQHGMGLRLRVKDGIALELEGFTYGEELPFHWELAGLEYIDAFRSTNPPIQRPASAPRYSGKAFTNVPGLAGTIEVREPPPPYPQH
jgi:hypothetical protein